MNPDDASTPTASGTAPGAVTAADPPAPAGATLRPPRLMVSSRAVAYWTVRAIPGWIVVFGLQVLWWVNDREHDRAHLIGMIVAAVLMAAHLAVMPRWRYRVHRWETTDLAVYTQSGWFNQERRIAPISRIQTVDSQRGPIEQLFGLANVTVTTASAAGPLHIRGLQLDVAQHLVDELTEVTAATEGDAT